MRSINKVWKSPDGVVIEVSDRLLETGAMVQVTVQKIGCGFSVTSGKAMDLQQTDAYLNRICAKHLCEDCPERQLCCEWNEAVCEEEAV